MTDGAGEKLLAAIEALHQEVREMRKEADDGRVVREQLERRKEGEARRSAEWRSRNVPSRENHVTSRDSNVTPGSLKALVLDPSPEKKEPKQKQLIPASRENHVRNVTETGPTWAAYTAAYLARHGARPVRNATVNGQMKRFVERVGVEEAPAVAEFYVGHSAAFYVSRLHPVGLLLQDSEKLRTEWITDKKMTATEARQIEQTQANLDGWTPLLSKGG